MPYWGNGWSAVVPGDAHIWSLQSVANLQFSVKKGDSYTLLFTILRFAAPIQHECFSVSNNDKEAHVVPISTDDRNIHQIYAAALGQIETDTLTISFKVNKLISFNEIAGDPDKLKRGIALHSVTLLACPAPLPNRQQAQTK